MKRTLTLFVALALAGCSETMLTGSSTLRVEPLALNERDTALVQQTIRDMLIDPESARFSDMRAGAAPDRRVVVCGWVNGRNRFGGYTGKQPFAGYLEGGRYVSPVIGGEDYILRAQIQDACGSLGDYYRGGVAVSLL